MIELKTARYKGVEFPVESFPTTGGNRLVKYLYLGSDKQSIERQGKLPKTFTLVAIIPHENYYQLKNDLLRVLDDGIKGPLTHPTFGDIENVINGQYSIDETITALGRATINIPFEVDDAIGVPVQSGSLPAQVQVQSNALNDRIEADLSSKFKVSRRFARNFSSALTTINNVSAKIAEAANFGEPIAANIAAFRSSINNFNGAVGSLIQSPADLAGEVRGLFEDLNNLFETPAETLGAFKTLFSFGADDPVIVETTVGLTERKQNQDAVRAAVRTQALSFSYVAAVQVEYMTDEELNNAQDELELAYVDAIENQVVSNEAVEELDRLRSQAQKTFDSIRVNTRSIVTVETPLKPLSVIAYEYYGSTELVNVLAELNDVNQNAFVSGQIKILTA